MASLLSRFLDTLSFRSRRSARDVPAAAPRSDPHRVPDWLRRPTGRTYPGMSPSPFSGGLAGAEPQAYTSPEVRGEFGERIFQWQDPTTWSHPPIAVVSSNLAEVAFDVPNRLLQVRFTKPGPNNGDTYRYVNIPPHLYFGLMDAPSKGKYFNAHLRCGFSYSDISGRSKLEGCGKPTDIGTGQRIPSTRRTKR